MRIFFVTISIITVVVLFHLNPLDLQSLDLTSAQDSVGKRFAEKFCEAKRDGIPEEESSEFALNNTYLKFVAFPNDEKYIESLWEFTIERIRSDCGDFLTEIEENELQGFFEEEGKIASNREFYLPNRSKVTN